uniref:Sialin n=1 Tax=Cupiennius salei TaxID=6928 RepID=A0A061QHU6_CUPSA
MEVYPDFDAGEVARTVALAVSNLHTRSQSSDSGNDETPLVRNRGRPDMNINTEHEPDDRNNLVSGGRSGWSYYFQYIPKRYILTFLGFLGFCNVYALRVNLSVAIVAMINHTATFKNSSAVEYECTASDPDPGDLPKDGEFDWDSEVRAHILGSFFYGYLVTQIPGGRMAEMFGGKWLFGIGVLCTAVLTLLTPLAAKTGYGTLIALRVLEGLGEGVTFPAMHAMLGCWMPKLERSMLSTIIYSGAQIGTVFAMPISGLLCDSDFLGGWPSVFYIFGCLGCLWFIFWAFFITETPEKHPTISRAELMLIQAGRNEDSGSEKKKPIPWKAIFTSVSVWTLMVTHFGQNWGFYTFLTELPDYLGSVLLFPLKKNGFLSALPYLLQAIVSWTVSYVADLLRQRQYFTISTIRKIFNTIGFFGPALCLFGVMLAACNHVWSVTFLTLAMGFNGCTYSGYMVTHVDMSPDFAGTLMGMTNAFATLAGILAPLAVGSLTKDNPSLAQWRIVFGIAACVYFLTGSLFIVFGSAKLQKWGISKEESPKEATHEEKDSDVEEK